MAWLWAWAPNESPPSSGPMAQSENLINFLGLWKLDAEPFSAAKGHDECAVFGGWGEETMSQDVLHGERGREASAG